MLRIKRINFKETYPLRNKILRPGKELSSCFFEKDESKESFHFGIFDNDLLVGVCTFLKDNKQEFEADSVYQLRGMAIDDNYQGKGVGRHLLVHAEAYLKNISSILIWCNARMSAISFYKNNGFQERGNEFEIPDVGLHKVMFKLL